MLANEGHLHVLAGGGRQLPAWWRGGQSLLLIPAHADQEEKAGNDQGDGDAWNQDVQNTHPAAVLGTCEQQGFYEFPSSPPAYSHLQLQYLSTSR